MGTCASSWPLPEAIRWPIHSIFPFREKGRGGFARSTLGWAAAAPATLHLVLQYDIQRISIPPDVTLMPAKTSQMQKIIDETLAYVIPETYLCTTRWDRLPVQCTLFVKNTKNHGPENRS